VNGSVDASTAQGYYFKAVAAARQGKADGVLSNLKSAVKADGAYKAKAANDREFIKWMNDPAFTSVVK
jgi:hypothetical protein